MSTTFEQDLTALSDRYTLHYFHSLPSTNTLLRELAKEGAPHNTLVIADSQSAGRGQYARSFFSPPGVGLYMSLLRRLPLPPEEFSFLTTGVAVACRRAILKVSGVGTACKWVNDLFFQEKKLAGILCEGSFTPEGRPDYSILGIGINCHTLVFPPQLESVATSLDLCGGKGYTRAALALALLEELEAILPCPSDALGEYKSHCKTLGEAVSVEVSGQICTGIAMGIAPDAALQVLLPSGEIVLKRSSLQ